MTTHVFIVDDTTFKYHLEYMFAGTGSGDVKIDFNDKSVTKLHYATENMLVSMIADFLRVNVGDLVIFYLQQNFSAGIFEGRFFGVFKVKSLAFFDNNTNRQFLHKELGKSLTFRCLIVPDDVYPIGVTEWEALDEIKNIQSPSQMLWSLIYRKLKGNRGNTMITIYESERLISLIRDKNHKTALKADGFTFDAETQEIVASKATKQYIGRQENINIFLRLLAKYKKNNQFEAHLQAYILQNFYETNFFGILQDEQIEWLGNEVKCGVGMQSIDILASVSSKTRKIIPIELKSSCVYPEILKQIQRYIDWLEQYYVPNRASDIQPVIVCRKTDRNSGDYKEFFNETQNFNKKNNILPLIYIEFAIENRNLTFARVF